MLIIKTRAEVCDGQFWASYKWDTFTGMLYQQVQQLSDVYGREVMLRAVLFLHYFLGLLFLLCLTYFKFSIGS